MPETIPETASKQYVVTLTDGDEYGTHIVGICKDIVDAINLAKEKFTTLDIDGATPFELSVCGSVLHYHCPRTEYSIEVHIVAV